MPTLLFRHQFILLKYYASFIIVGKQQYDGLSSGKLHIEDFSSNLMTIKPKNT